MESLIDRAIRYASSSNHTLHHHVAFVFYKGSLLAYAVNKDWRHAEERAIRKTFIWKRYLHGGKKPLAKIRGAIVWSFRVAKDNIIRDAKPCETCEDKMRELGIEKIYYSDPTGDIRCLIL